MGAIVERKGNKGLIRNAREPRRNMTREERSLWFGFLRTYPERLTRQRILGEYIVDFYCAKAQLVIEPDGSQHYAAERQEYEKNRTCFPEGYGLKIIRIPDHEVNQNFRGVCELIDSEVKRRIREFHMPKPAGGEE